MFNLDTSTGKLIIFFNGDYLKESSGNFVMKLTSTHLSIKTDSGGLILRETILTNIQLNGSSVFTNIELSNALNLTGTLKTVISGGGTGGGTGGGSTSALQNQTLGVINTVKTVLDDIQASTDDPGIIAKLEEARLISVTNSTAIGNVLTELTEQGVELDKIDSIRTATDGVKASIELAEAAEALRDALELQALQNNKSAIDDARIAIVAAINGLGSSNTETIGGIDDGNGERLLRRTNLDTNTEEYVTYLGDPYTTFVGAFAPNPNVTVTVVPEIFRAEVDGAGYDADDKIERITIFENGVEAGVTYSNVTQGTTLLTNSVQERDLTTDPKPNEFNTLEFFAMNNTTEVKRALIFKVLRNDETFVYKDSESGSILQSPNFPDETLVEIHNEDPIAQNERSWNANTIKRISIIVPVGSTGVYDLAVNGAIVTRLTELTNGWQYNTGQGPKSFINFDIELIQITAGDINILGYKPKLPVPDNTNQAFVNSGTAFIVDAALSTAGIVNSLSVPIETGSTDMFTNSGTDLVSTTVNGLKALTSSASLSINTTLTTPVNNQESITFVGGAFNFNTQTGNMFRITWPLLQVAVLATGNLFYNINGTWLQTPIADLNLSTAELAGTQSVIFGVRRTLINAGANFQYELIIYNADRPNGRIINTVTGNVVGTAATIFNIGSNYALHYLAASVKLAGEVGMLSIVKTNSGI